MLDLFSIYYKNAYLKYRNNLDDVKLGYALECREKVWKEFIELAKNHNLSLNDFEISVIELDTGLMSRLELDSMFAQFYDFGTEKPSREIIEKAAGILFDSAYDFVKRFIQTEETYILVGVWFKLTTLVGVNREVLEMERYFGKSEQVTPRLSADMDKLVEELYEYYREVR